MYNHGLFIVACDFAPLVLLKEMVEMDESLFVSDEVRSHGLAFDG